MSQQAAGGATTGQLGSTNGTTGENSPPSLVCGGCSTDGSTTGKATTGATGSSSGSTGTSTGGVVGSTTFNVTGVTATTITIGFIYTTGRGQAAAALGAAGVTSGDELAQWKLIINAVNKSGGLGGRQIKPVWYGESDTSGQSVSTQETAACQAFTQDNHVAAAFSSFEYTNGFIDCMSKHGIPTAYSLETLNSSSTFRQYPLQLEPTDLALDRQGTELGSSLFAQGYFKAGTLGAAVNGIIAYDTPAYRAGVAALTSVLKSKGIGVKDVRYIPFATNNSDTGSLAAALSSAELAFASEQVDHVMFFDLNGLLAFLFMTQAQSQEYHPRYGLTSQSSGSHLADLLKGNANAQLQGALGIGWIPVLDLHTTDYGPDQGPAARKHCRQIMLNGGQSQGLSSPGAELVATGQCDVLFSLQAAFQHLSGSVSGASIRAALRALGTSYQPAGTFTTSFGTGRQDGVSSIRDVAYNTSCACFRYTTALRAIS